MWVTLKVPPIQGKVPDGPAALAAPAAPAAPAAQPVTEAPKAPEDPEETEEAMLEQSTFPDEADMEDVFNLGGSIDDE